MLMKSGARKARFKLQGGREGGRIPGRGGGGYRAPGMARARHSRRRSISRRGAAVGAAAGHPVQAPPGRRSGAQDQEASERQAARLWLADKTCYRPATGGPCLWVVWSWWTGRGDGEWDWRGRRRSRQGVVGTPHIAVKRSPGIRRRGPPGDAWPGTATTASRIAARRRDRPRRWRTLCARPRCRGSGCHRSVAPG